MKANYWSCSKFANWIRGTNKLSAGTAEQWHEWTKHAKLKKFRYWLAEDGLDAVQDIVYWPVTQVHNARHYVNCRWVTPTHALTASSLARGQFHEFDTRLLHCMFDELVNFVEVEQAWMNVVFDKAASKKYATPWWRKLRLWRRWRSPEAGLAYLDWASKLTYDEDWFDKNDPKFGKRTPQAVAAVETLTLYNWWKHQRPARPDPMDASGWSAHCEQGRQAAVDDGDSFFSSMLHNKTAKEQRQVKKLLDLMTKMEQQYDDEDQAMMIRLIKLRKSLWT